MEEYYQKVGRHHAATGQGGMLHSTSRQLILLLSQGQGGRGGLRRCLLLPQVMVGQKRETGEGGRGESHLLLHTLL